MLMIKWMACNVNNATKPRRTIKNFLDILSYPYLCRFDSCPNTEALTNLSMFFFTMSLLNS